MGRAEDSTTAYFHFDKTNINMSINIIILSYNVALILTHALEFIVNLQNNRKLTLGVKKTELTKPLLE